MNTIITNITIGNWYLVRGKPTKMSPANVVWAFRDGCSPMPLTDEILKNMVSNGREAQVIGMTTSTTLASYTGIKIKLS